MRPRLSPVDAERAARTWVRTWSEAWPRRDARAIAALYAGDASYRALAFREPDTGPAGALGYLERTFADEREIECKFGEPVVSGRRAAVEWWASWLEDGRPTTLSGVTLLQFDDQGKVVHHRDYWNQSPERRDPYPGW